MDKSKCSYNMSTDRYGEVEFHPDVQNAYQQWSSAQDSLYKIQGEILQHPTLGTKQMWATEKHYQTITDKAKAVLEIARQTVERQTAEMNV